MARVRRLWILSEQRWGQVRLGPIERALSLARLAEECGYEPRLACTSWDAQAPQGVTPELLVPSLFDKISPEDGIISSLFLPPRMHWSLLRSRHPFHADFYCVSALEGMESVEGMSTGRVRRGRTRTHLRYRMMARAAERIYVSTPIQAGFLAGTAYPGSGVSDTWIPRLPQRLIEAPMGIRESPFPDSTPNPYPAALQGRPILLWGGGIWRWYDIRILLEAFARLAEQDAAPVLYFLAGKNPSQEPTQDSPPLQARETARRLGILGKNVFFHDAPVPPDALPAFLLHARAGILSNLPSLEAMASWRTRYLDLAWAGRPLLAHGSDPLAERLEAAGVARIHRGSDAGGLSQAVLDLVAAPPPPPESFLAIRRALSTEALLRGVRAALLAPEAFRTVGPPPTPLEWIRWGFGA